MILFIYIKHNVSLSVRCEGQVSICCNSGEPFIKIASLLFGSIFKILFNCDFISCKADMCSGVN